jgi:N-acylneuraminate cytidylyltransferase
MIALVPARLGSRRIPRKNIRPLAGHPLLAYTIAAARESGVFTEVLVSSESLEVGQIATAYGANWLPREDAFATDDAADILWVQAALKTVPCDAFAILRPTSPFRTADTIRRAHRKFYTNEAHSLRAVQPAKEHPGKMWAWDGPGYPMTPLLSYQRSDGVPWHSSPTQTLPTFYMQNASLEMCWAYVARDLNSITGKKVVPFLTEGYEGFDLNTDRDWHEAERLLAEGLVSLPALDVAALREAAGAL